MKRMLWIFSLILILSLFLSTQVFAVQAHPFRDVESGCWYDSAVAYVYAHKLMNGTAEDSFSPDVNMTRAMLVTVLYSLEGQPNPEGEVPFEDVAQGQYYYAPVAWAYGNNIVSGTSATAFSPDLDISREQMVAIFSKYAQYKGLEIPAEADIDSYADAHTVSAYARNAISWAVGNGIISGTSPTTLSPANGATRAQCAVIMNRFIEWTEAAEGTHPTVTPSPTVMPTPTASPVATPKPGQNQTPFA